MNATPFKGVLICTTGQSAGAKFDLGAEAFIGVNGREQFTVSNDATHLTTLVARIVVEGGRYILMRVGPLGSVFVDGRAVTTQLPLEKLSVISVGQLCEFVFRGSVTEPMKRVPRPPDPPRSNNDGSAPGAARGAGRGASSRPGHSAMDGETTTVYHLHTEPKPIVELMVDLPGQGKIAYPLKFGDNLLGRGLGCDIRIPDSEKLISRKHAIVRVTGNGVQLRDLHGDNGTYVQGKRIETAAIAVGDSFVLGPHLKVTLREVRDKAAT